MPRPVRRHSHSQTRRGLRLLAGSVGLLASAMMVAGPAVGSEPGRIGDPLPDVPPGPVQVGLESVTRDVIAPLAGIVAPGRPNMLYLVDQVGQLKELDLTAPRPVTSVPTALDVSSLLVGPQDPKDERGFLGAAFSPSFATDGRLYTYTSEAFNPATPATFPLPPDPPGPCDLRGVQPDHRSVVREWQRTSTNPLGFEAVADSRVLFTVDQPQSNHNAGDMTFGPDGMLYIAFGDGGGADDQNCQTNFDGNPMFGHGANGNGQNPTNPLGDILRIDPTGTNAANGMYGIPADNPFVTSNPRGELPEIFATGFRNPFRISFDAADFSAANAGRPAELWVGDVGQNDVEEVDVVRAGGNYGWRVKEGAFQFNPDGFALKGSRSDGFVSAPTTAGFVDPVAQYDHDDGTAIIGGYVYRGTESPALTGQYVFGDTSRRLNNAHGRLFATSGAKAGPHQVVELRDGPLDVQLIGFGQDADRELYALVFEPGATGDVLHITG
ncbi:MAG TPA: PQQ-dependent sugar dehydrogenase [Propionibacteriaceae bacterium]|nr:PQQ-dependent sugar dehydrogenase [Propionibacteriaceae bacterium]